MYQSSSASSLICVLKAFEIAQPLRAAKPWFPKRLLSEVTEVVSSVRRNTRASRLFPEHAAVAPLAVLRPRS